MKQITTEEMRYKVPKVKNRFIAAHMSFIIICAIVTAITVILFASFLYVSESRKLEPKPAIIFTCEVTDIDACNRISDKFTQTVEIYFAKYDEQFENTKENSYDFSCVSSAVGNETLDENVALVVFKNDRGSFLRYFFKEFELTNAALTSQQVEEIVRRLLTQ